MARVETQHFSSKNCSFFFGLNFRKIGLFFIPIHSGHTAAAGKSHLNFFLPLETELLRLEPDSSRLDLGAERSRSFSPILSMSFNRDFRCFGGSVVSIISVPPPARWRCTIGSLLDCLIRGGGRENEEEGSFPRISDILSKN